MGSQYNFKREPLFSKTSAGPRRKLYTPKYDELKTQLEKLRNACQSGSVEDVRSYSDSLRQNLAKFNQLPDIIRAIYDRRTPTDSVNGRTSLSTKSDLLRALLGYRTTDDRSDNVENVVKIFYAILKQAPSKSEDDYEFETSDFEDDFDDEEVDAETDLLGDGTDSSNGNWSQWVIGEINIYEPQLMTHQIGDLGLGLPEDTILLESAINLGAAWAVPDFANNSGNVDSTWLHELFDNLSRKPILERVVQIPALTGLGLFKKLIGACKSLEGSHQLPESKLEALLSAIIGKGNLKMLRYLNEQYSTLLTLSHQGQTALQMLRQSGISGERRSEMEKYVKEQILTLQDMPLSETRKLLEHELYLDLTQFDWEQVELNKFITRMKTLPIRLEDVLLHVHLPELVMRGTFEAGPQKSENSNAIPSEEENQRSRTEVKDILDWLRKTYGVNSIKELVVKDNLHDSHWEETIEECLRPFSRIEHLNWRKIDLSMRSISAVKSLRELWLYSSGNWNSIAHWLSAEGLRSITSLRKVHLIFVKGLMSNEHLKRSVDYAEERLKVWKSERNDVQIEIDTQGWPKQVSNVNKRNNPHLDRLPASILNLEKFLLAYRTIRFRRDRAIVKVAIIDTGIDLADETLAKVVEKGVSFYQSDAGRKESPWYLPMDPHGSQMARIILDLCHDVRFYIAKVATDRRSVIRQEDVKKAIKWAADEKVDLINMSMVIRDEQSKRIELEELVSSSAFAFIGSTADQGSYNFKSCFPTNTNSDRGIPHKTDVLTIAACDHLGTPLPSANVDAAFNFFGDRMAVKSTRGVDEVTGSSVATAVATGIAALTLGLNQYANPGDKRKRADVIYEVFNKMKIDKKNSQYVNPDSFFTPTVFDKPSDSMKAWTDSRMVEWAKTAI